MSKYMIRCDVDGVSGVSIYEQTDPGYAEYEYGRQMFMGDLLAAVEGLLAGGAEAVTIYDEHFNGRNIDVAALPEGVTEISGKPPYRADWAGGLDESFAGVVLVGFHSKSGTEGAFVPHTYEPDIRELRINGVSVGEVGMEAAVAGDWNVPVLMVAGELGGVREAEALLGGVIGVAVKEAVSEAEARCYPVSETRKAIRAAAEEIVKSPPKVEPYRVGNEVTLEVELNDGIYLDAVRRELAGEMSSDRCLVIDGNSATAVWAEYWQRKLHCQEAATE